MQVSSPSEPTPTEQSRAAIEAIESSVFQRDLTFKWIHPDGTLVDRVYTQAQLGMFPVQEFATTVTEVLESFTEGELRMKLGELFQGKVQMPVNLDADTVNSFVDDNMAYIQAFFQLVRKVPELQLDVICLSLGVPRQERAWAKQQLAEPPHRGGLTVEEGFDLLITFIKQNASLLRETLVGKAKELGAVFMEEVLDQIPDLEGTATETEKAPTSEVASTPGGTPSSTSSLATLEND